MAKTYELTPARRVVNRLMKTLIRLGFGPSNTVLLTVQGRKSGKLYSTPVSLVQENGQRWLVAPYGPVSWVQNARAAGQVTLTRGKQSESVSLQELSPEESAPILKLYVKQEAITRPYFDAQPDSPIEAFVAEAARHPVFLIRP